jgi:hypothetical protein
MSKKRRHGSVERILERQLDLAMLLETVAEAVRDHGHDWYEYAAEEFDPDFFPSFTSGEIEGTLKILLRQDPSTINTSRMCFKILRDSGVLVQRQIRIDP